MLFGKRPGDLPPAHPVVAHGGDLGRVDAGRIGEGENPNRTAHAVYIGQGIELVGVGRDAGVGESVDHAFGVVARSLVLGILRASPRLAPEGEGARRRQDSDEDDQEEDANGFCHGEYVLPATGPGNSPWCSSATLVGA